MYVTTLERQPDTGGLNFWSTVLQTGAGTGADIATEFIFSEEMWRRNLSNSHFVEVMYNAFFGRPSEAEGRIFWIGLLDSGTNRKVIFQEFVNSDEFRDICNQYNIIQGKYIAPPETEYERFATEVFRLTNIERARHGLPALRNDNNILNQAAMVRAGEIIGFFSHMRPDGRRPSTAYTDLGGRFSIIAENIAAGQWSPQAVVNAWMNSTTGHREAILGSSYTHIGIGVIRDSNGRLYWVQLFLLP